jgi:hypothetical protein
MPLNTYGYDEANCLYDQPQTTYDNNFSGHGNGYDQYLATYDSGTLLYDEIITRQVDSYSLPIPNFGYDSPYFKYDTTGQYDAWPGSSSTIDRVVIHSEYLIRTVDRYGVQGVGSEGMLIRTLDRYRVAQEFLIQELDRYRILPSLIPLPPADPSHFQGFGGALGSFGTVAGRTITSGYISPFAVTVSRNLPMPTDITTFKVVNSKTGNEVELVDKQGSQLPFQFNLNWAESQPSTFSLSIVDPFGTYSPLNKKSVWKDVMDEKPFGADSANQDLPRYVKGVLYPTQIKPQLVKELVVSAKIGGRDWVWHGIGSAWSHRRNWETRYFDFSWKGTDHAVRLIKENQNFQTIRSSSRTGIHMASEALIEMIKGYAVKYDLRNFLKDDFIIPIFHRSNANPLDLIVQILSTLCYEWTMKEGNVFTPYLPMPVPTGAANASYYNQQDGKYILGNDVYGYDFSAMTPEFTHVFKDMCIYDESYEGSMMALYNRVIAIRSAEGGNSPTYGMDVFNFGGDYSMSFSPPLSNVQHIVTAQNNGFFSNFKYYKQGQLIATRDITTGSVNFGIEMTSSGIINGADEVRFTWGVLPGGFIGIGAPGHIEFHGTSEVEASAWGGAPLFGKAIDQGPDAPAPMMRAFAENIKLIKEYDLRQIEIPASPLHPNRITLQKFANRMLFRLSRQARKASYSIPLNPWITSGTVIREKDHSLGMSLSSPLERDRVATSGSHVFTNDMSVRRTTYSGNDYVEVT